MINKLKIKNLEVLYDNRFLVVKNLSFDINKGEIISIIGPSGCGKTTILNAIAGFIKSKHKSIYLNGEHINNSKIKMGIIFQGYELFPWKTVEDNIEFGLKIKNFDKKKRKMIARKYVELVGLKGFENYYPNKLSGGMKQRVGLARALASEPDIILMDEPFGQLDNLTRIKMQELLLDIYYKTKKPIIFVTHHIDEAIFLSDKIIVLTKRPARIKKIIKVKIPRPRTHNKLFKNNNYIKLKEQIFSLLKKESTLR